MNFNFFQDSEEGGNLILLIALDNELKKWNKSKRKYQVPEFFRKPEEKGPFTNLTRNETSRYEVFFS